MSTRAQRLEIIAAAAVGLAFGLGLVLSGMSNPTKVLGFLDLAGAWDPSLALVMAGAIAVGSIGFGFAGRRGRSALGLPMRLPASRHIDRRLVIGATTFGVGWGLVGLCPGPAIVALASGSWQAFAFVGAMLAGMALHDLPLRRTAGALPGE
jgi:uncharacterized protein